MQQTDLKSSQTKTAYLKIREQILCGELKEGYPLLETELAEQFHMSRTPVREALQRLRADGLVERVRNKGMFVKSMSKEEVRQSYEFLEGVEGMLCYLLAQSIPPEGLAELQRHLLIMESALEKGDVDLWANADTMFHNAMLKYCKNEFIVSEMEKVNILVRNVREIFTKYAIDKAKSTQDHRAAFEAIRHGDADRARVLAQRHISSIRSQLMHIL